MLKAIRFHWMLFFTGLFWQILWMVLLLLVMLVNWLQIIMININEYFQVQWICSTYQCLVYSLCCFTVCLGRNRKVIIGIVVGFISTSSFQVVRMLPGGLDVIGLFVVTPQSDYDTSQSQSKIRSILGAVHRTAAKILLETAELRTEKIILHVCTQSFKYVWTLIPFFFLFLSSSFVSHQIVVGLNRKSINFRFSVWAQDSY